MKLNLQYVRLGVVLNYTKIVSAAAVQQIAARVAATALVADVALGMFLELLQLDDDRARVLDAFSLSVHKEVLELSTVVDSLTKELGRGVSDTAHMGPDLVQIRLDRVIVEYPTTHDHMVRQLTKTGWIELGRVSDLVQLQLNKNRADQARATDVLGPKVIGKNPMEVVSTTDVMTRVAAFNRTWVETPKATDSLAKAFSRAVNDALMVTDAIQTAYAPGRVMSPDGMGATDVINAKNVIKVLLDTPRTSEVLTKTTTRAIHEGAYLGDLVIRNFTKPRSDLASATDQLTRSLSKSPVDTPRATDAGTVFNHSYAPGYFAEEYVGQYVVF